MERVKRPKLERTQAIRTAAALLGFAGGAARAAGESTSGGGAAAGDVVGRSVDLGYRVVEEYIRQGQKTAERMSGGTYGPDAVAGDLQEFGMRMVRYASEFMAVWLDFIDRVAVGGAGPRAFGPPVAPDGGSATPATARPGGAASDGADRTRVRVEIASPWPTEVALDLHPDAGRRPLVVHALRAIEPDKPRIDSVSFHGRSTDAPATVRIRVPAEQPPGVYSGLIVDEETAAPAGTLSVRVSHHA